LQKKLEKKKEAEEENQLDYMKQLNKTKELLRMLEGLDVVPFGRKCATMEITAEDREADKTTAKAGLEVAVVQAFTKALSCLRIKNWLTFLRRLLSIQIAMCMVE
jgi:hypothetical protein